MNNYKGYTITLNEKPIPSRALDWDYAHEDFDGAPDSDDRRRGSAGSVQECKEQIDDLFAINE